jgi:hypothetical protein
MNGFPDDGGAQTEIFGNKIQLFPRTGHEVPEGYCRSSSTLSLTSVLDAGGCLTPRPGRFTPGNYPIYIV